MELSIFGYYVDVYILLQHFSKGGQAKAININKQFNVYAVHKYSLKPNNFYVCNLATSRLKC